MRQYTHLTEHERYHIWLMIGNTDGEGCYKEQVFCLPTLL